MDYSLTNHAQKYSISCKDVLFSVATVLSGAPLAKRHWELAKTDEKHALGHRIIACIEYVPVLGLIAALIERIVVCLFCRISEQKGPESSLTQKTITVPSSEEKAKSDDQKVGKTATIDKGSQKIDALRDKTPLKAKDSEPNAEAPMQTTYIDLGWKPRKLDEKTAIGKMHKNASKAIAEHFAKNPNEVYALPADEKALPFLEDFLTEQSGPPLSFAHSEANAQGPARDENEDDHFYLKMEGGVLAGVFDGHNGDAVSKYACKEFKNRFPEALRKANNNVHQAFEALIYQIHKETLRRDDWGEVGSTAVICYIDKNTRRIYTATLSDSEAKIYRKIDGCLKSIPISPLRDWSSPKEIKRAAMVLKDPLIETLWPKAKNQKELRFGPNYQKGWGLNCSRGFGDHKTSIINGKSGIISKPKISIQILQPGDIVVLGCDGLWDYVEEEDLVEEIRQKGSSPKLADHLVDFAVKKMNPDNGDNTTVIAIQVE